MYLCLSGRIVEASNPRPSLVEFVRLARDTGYQGVGLRQWQITPQTTAQELRLLEAELAATGLRVSSISTTPDAVKALVPVARALGVKTFRVAGAPAALSRVAEDLDADMRIGPQMHTGSEFETVALAAQTLQQADDRRVGVIVEPSNHLMAGELFSRNLFAPLAGRIIGCNLQSIEVGTGDSVLALRDGAKVTYRRVDPAQNRQIDFAAFFESLRAAGYDGYVDVIEPAARDKSIEETARGAAEYLRGVLPGS
ncbi:MAG TPA: sugar phosphate isomerase/epimerase [Candidatus Brocadiia bacterium]|nr:sugar phosphate isomerase/epimerase [Candidatus Brocadiia bacterium]